MMFEAENRLSVSDDRLILRVQRCAEKMERGDIVGIRRQSEP